MAGAGEDRSETMKHGSAVCLGDGTLSILTAVMRLRQQNLRTGSARGSLCVGKIFS